MATQSVKDILGTEVPKPSFVLSPSVPAPLPSGVTHTRNGQDNVARTLDPYSGKFEQVGEDTPRVYGDDQSLLVEPMSATNDCHYSANIARWEGPDGAGVASIFADKNVGSARSVTGRLDRRAGNFGSLSSQTEAASFIIEEDGANGVNIKINDQGIPSRIFAAKYYFSDNQLDIYEGNVISASFEVLSQSGPNNNKTVRLFFVYNPTKNGASGNNRQLVFLPNISTASPTIVHHGQVEVNDNPTSPIVTSNGSKTRAADTYTIFADQPSWFNENQGTFYAELVPRHTDPNRISIVESPTGDPWMYLSSATSNYSAYIWDGTNAAETSKNAKPFETAKVATSATGTELRAALNGDTATADHNSNRLSDVELQIGQDNDAVMTIKKIIYYPRALPESTLNTLTS